VAVNVQGDLGAREKFHRDLMPGENILWAGKPAPGLYLSAWDLPQMISGLVIGVLAIYWMQAVYSTIMLFGHHAAHVQSSQSVPRFLPLIGLPIFLAGFSQFLAPFTYNRWKNANTCYAITGTRVLTLVEKPMRNLQSMAIADIPSVGKNVRENGIGTVSFGGSPKMEFFKMMSNAGWFNRRREQVYPLFRDIPDADAVYNLVCGIRSAK
jgi:hypothetical protein